MPTSLGDPAENENALKNLNLAQFITAEQQRRKADGDTHVIPGTVNENLSYMAGTLSKPDEAKTSKVAAGFGTRNEGQVTKSGSTGRPWSKRVEESSKTPAEKWYGKTTPTRKPKNAKRGKK